MSWQPAAVPGATKTTDHKDHSVIEPPLTLKTRALLTGAVAEKELADQMAQGELAMGRLKIEFGGWMEKEVLRLEESYSAYVQNAQQERDVLYRALHDVRGQSAMFGFPLAGRIADNLCKLLDVTAQVPSEIVGAHVHAIRAVVRENATSPDDPVGSLLAQALEKVTKVLAAREVA
ncbi:MAG: Hpt domain-containing protein [Bosea sp. (in: a-proteobacteria)]